MGDRDTCDVDTENIFLEIVTMKITYKLYQEPETLKYGKEKVAKCVYLHGKVTSKNV